MNSQRPNDAQSITPYVEALREARDCIACDNGLAAADGLEPGAWTNGDVEELTARIDALLSGQQPTPGEMKAIVEARGKTPAPEASGLADFVLARIGQTFDGECHLNETEAKAIARALRHTSTATDELVEALEWYGEQARLARLIHSEGDAGRAALAADGGNRARTLLTKLHERKGQ